MFTLSTPPIDKAYGSVGEHLRGMLDGLGWFGSNTTKGKREEQQKMKQKQPLLRRATTVPRNQGGSGTRLATQTHGLGTN